MLVSIEIKIQTPVALDAAAELDYWRNALERVVEGDIFLLDEKMMLVTEHVGVDQERIPRGLTNHTKGRLLIGIDHKPSDEEVPF